jgi:hypothetical protein
MLKRNIFDSRQYYRVCEKLARKNDENYRGNYLEEKENIKLLLYFF